MRTESKLRSLIKSCTWRLIAILDTILVVMVVTCLHGRCSIEDALAIGVFEFGFKFVVYYIHERIWQRIDLKHRKDRTRTIVKTISWRAVATIMTFVIAGVVLKNENEIAVTIALIEIVTKSLFYYLHERVWINVPLGRIRKLLIKQ
ncbi:DUF2061 domain-containing protein [Lutibacter sp. HS1-25]|uniref:DUF2061 domain-containing protein n=1 Tax=Lutibacter sp. HS1-25 TaxID=2485000 RepID=UPI00101096AF|nr:DUF2061 domain-containing protein [Lutibacter sp. HS1-25]RXP45421.1 DUF2061 domain-containing protein [Lutibacter sp. HS1-25]